MQFKAATLTTQCLKECLMLQLTTPLMRMGNE